MRPTKNLDAGEQTRRAHRAVMRMTLAGIAMSSSLPAGVAASTVYLLKESQHEGAE